MRTAGLLAAECGYRFDMRWDILAGMGARAACAIGAAVVLTTLVGCVSAGEARLPVPAAAASPRVAEDPPALIEARRIIGLVRVTFGMNSYERLMKSIFVLNFTRMPAFAGSRSSAR